MKVIDAIDALSLKEISNNLYSRVLECDYNPDLIIGIANGGWYVVRSMSLSSGVSVLKIKKQRAGTLVKNKFRINHFLPKLPVLFNNFLRMLEIAVREILFLLRRGGCSVSELKIDGEDALAVRRASNILLVDDSIDSGCTVKLVMGALRNLNPDCAIKIGVINTTFANPVISPDFCLFNRTIVRFPWAGDVKGNDLFKRAMGDT